MDALGFNLHWFIFQAINFAVLAFGLNYLLHKPIINLLDNRRKEVRESLEQAERLKKELAENETEQRELMEKSRTEASELLKHAHEQAKALEASLSEKAQTKANQILSQAEADLTAERSRLQVELRGEVAEMVIKATEKVLAHQLPAEVKQAQLAKLVEELPHATK